MHKFIRMWALVAVLTGTAGVASAATPSEFYLGLLHRGTAAYDAGRYADAQRQLSIAAFGLVEAVDQYQIAQVYLTLTHDKLGDPDRAREAAHRLVLAERVERKYASLQLPAELRTAFEATANRLLSANESAMLLRGAPMTPPPPPAAQQRPAATTRTAPSTPPPRTATAVPQAKPQPSQASASQSPTLPEPRTTTPESAPRQNTSPAPQTTKPQTTKPASTATATTQPRPAPPPTTKPSSALTASEVATRLTAAERGLNAGKLDEARRAYRELLGAPGLDRDKLIRIAEGLYRARDFSSALTAFNRVGTLRRGEEAYRYYIAVAFYETGDVARAKKELAAALPYIEVTPDVARYRTKIEGSL
jgi:tetratricopeptide (TPR) repeat protein